MDKQNLERNWWNWHFLNRTDANPGITYNWNTETARSGYIDRVAKLRDRKEHSWLKGLSPEQRRNMLDFYESRYGQNTVTFEGS